MDHLDLAFAPTPPRASDHATDDVRTDAWALLAHGAVTAVDGDDHQLAATLADAIYELEHALGIPLGGPDPAPVVTARRLARVDRAARRAATPLDATVLTRVATRVAQAAWAPAAARRSRGRDPYVAHRQSHSTGPIRNRDSHNGHIPSTRAQMPMTTASELKVVRSS